MRALFATGAAVALAGLALVTSAAATASPDHGSARAAAAPVVRVEPVAHGPAIASTSVLRAAGAATPLTVTSAGQVLTFVYAVTNAGGRPVTDPSVTGTLRGTVVTVACPAGAVPPGGTVTCTGTYRVRAGDLGAGVLTLSASVGATADGREVGLADVAATTVVQQRGVRPAHAPIAPAATAEATDPVAAPAGAAHRRLGAAPSTPSPSGTATWSGGPVAYTGAGDTGVAVLAGLVLLLAGGLLLFLARPRAAHHARSTVGRWRH